MTQTLLEMAKDLTRSLVETGSLSAENMQDVLQQTHTTLSMLRGQEESGDMTAFPVADSSPVDWRKSIRKHAKYRCTMFFIRSGAEPNIFGANAQPPVRKL